MPTCAVINSNNIVVNIIVADPVTDTPPEGTTLLPLYFANIGYIWNGSDFVAPIPVEEILVEDSPVESTPISVDDILVEDLPVGSI